MNKPLHREIQELRHEVDGNPPDEIRLRDWLSSTLDLMERLAYAAERLAENASCPSRTAVVPPP